MVSVLRSYLDLLEQQLGISSPVFVSLSLTGVEGYSMALSPRKDANHMGRNEFDKDRIESPVVRVEDFDRSSSEILREPFRYVWNAAGFWESMYIDDGEWTL